MNLPHLDQTIELARGEAHLYYFAVATVWQRAVVAITAEQPQPISAELLQVLPVLEKLGKRLHRIDLSEKKQVGKPSSRARKFKLPLNQLAATMQHVLPVAGGPVQVVLGKVQQKSLNVSAYVRFS